MLKIKLGQTITYVTIGQRISESNLCIVTLNNTACTVAAGYIINNVPLHAILIVHLHVMIVLETMFILYLNR